MTLGEFSNPGREARTSTETDQSVNNTIALEIVKNKTETPDDERSKRFELPALGSRHLARLEKTKLSPERIRRRAPQPNNRPNDGFVQHQRGIESKGRR